MPTYLRRAFTSFPMILMACVAMNKQLAAQSIFESCAKDLEIYCSQVTPGNGRISACIYAHEDKVSDECDAASDNFSTLLDWFLEQARYTYDQCADDVQKYCVGTEFGAGRIFSCLIENESQITNGCKEVVSSYVGRLE